ncbi:MAG: histidinol-phosphatase HisJ family protein [Clostridiales bacterium]|nr:histidinol-phosphatase HisJ family protein [Clostridiales bacterium]
MRIDLHTHTWRCRHATGTAEEYVAAARIAGIDVIGLTDHLPLPSGLDPAVCYAMPISEFETHLAELHEVAANSDGVHVCVGIEADWLPSHPGHVEGMLAGRKFDVVLGSVHMIDGWTFDDPDLIHMWDSRDVVEAWERYFAELCDAAASGLYDVLAHPDLIKKFGHRPAEEPLALYDDVAAQLARTGVAIEVSSAGLRKPVSEIYPGHGLLAACARAGVPATTASDAHTPEEVGVGLDAVREALVRAGYTRVVYFVGREKREVPL